MTPNIKTPAYYDEGFRHLDDHLHDVMEVLAEALPLEEDALAQIPWLNESAEQTSRSQSTRSSQVQSLAFELLNMVEEHVASRFRSRRRSQHGAAAVSGLWPDMLNSIVQAGCTEEEALAAFKQVRVEPVLTAHPTEPKRPAVREKHLAIYQKLAEWEAVRSDSARAHHRRAALRAELESLWFTGEIFIERPSVTRELRNAVYYLREVFPEVALRLDRSLESAWAQQGWSLERLRAENAYPQVRFATWIGGDRDGHPLVTPEITATSLRELRSHAARLHRRWLRRAADSLPLAPPFIDRPQELLDAIAAMEESFGDPGHRIVKRNINEPWKAWLFLLREKMGRLAEDGGYRTTDEYRTDLELIHRTLLEAKAQHSADEFVRPLLRLTEVFGFHLAAIDIRQNSATHDEAFSAMLQCAGIDEGAQFPEWSEERRQALLTEELANPRPLLPPGCDLPDEIQKVIAPLRVFAKHADQFGDEGLGQLIVSMTRQPSDLLLVHILSREAGLGRYEEGRWQARLPVTPLFETGDDLAHAGDVLQSYFDLKGRTPEIQPAMVGYSDSNKDAGTFASHWGIFQALERITNVCTSAGATPQIFHGRGGTIGRGAGPTQWFLRALPIQSHAGPVRFTEQGEVLPRKYAHEGNANYHLELLIAGVSAAHCTAPRTAPMAADHRAALDHVAVKSTEAYQELLHAPNFIDFYRSITPIDALEAGTFGSRPPRRTGSGDHSINDLRAIPWVFSWTQSRFYLPGWFGVGSGLAALQAEQPESYQQLQNSLSELPFLRYLLTNVESSLASANLEVMRTYASLCEDAKLRERILSMIEQELQTTRDQLAAFFGQDFSKRRPRLHHTLDLRDGPLRQLHEQQITLLQNWRQEDRPVAHERKRFHPLFLALQLNINAIASGLRETG